MGHAKHYRTDLWTMLYRVIALLPSGLAGLDQDMGGQCVGTRQ